MKKIYLIIALIVVAFCFNALALGAEIYSNPISKIVDSDRAYDDSQRRGVPSSILVWDQSVEKNKDGHYYVISKAPQPFTTMAVLWKTSHEKPTADSFSVLFRAKEKGGNWTDFRKVSGEYHPSETGRNLYVGELILLSDTQVFDEFEVFIIPLVSVNIERIEIDLTDITEAEGLFKNIKAEKVTDSNRSGLEFPEIIRRSSWCQTDACLNPTYTVNYIEATHTIIHYGAVPDNYTSGAAVVFSYWNHHVNTNLWFDIGYNYLVDKFGNLFEGRHNPNLPNQDVRAAHAGASNAVSIGINFLGNTDAPALNPTSEQLDKNIEILAWWYNNKELDPTSTADIILQDPSGEIGPRPRILGHKDVGNTSCPGNVLHAMLPQMRLDVLEAMNVPDIYSIGTENIDGEVGNFSSFREAVTFLNNHGTFEKDIIMYVTSDLEEDCTAGGVGLAVDPSPHTVIFKPAPEITPTIAFHYPNDSNAGPSGAFIIGIPHTNNIAWADATLTKNIIFDGSNTPGGETRDLTFTNTIGTHRNGMPFLLVGNVEGITIRNLNIHHKATNQANLTQVGFNGALSFRVNHNAATNNAAREIVIENNHISVEFEGVSPGYNGINVFKTGSGSVGYLQNIEIRNNLIEGKANGLFLPWLGDGAEITGNEIKVNQDGGTGILANSGIQLPITLAGSNVLIEANNFSHISNLGTAANVSIVAIDVVSSGNYTIANNMTTGFEVTATENHAGLMAGVRIDNGGANVLLAYNSILLNDLANVSAPGALVYEGVKLGAGSLEMKNNIIVSHEDNLSNYLVNLATLPTSMSHNLYYLGSSGKSGSLGFYNGTAHPNLNDWQTATGMDANSIQEDPLFVSNNDLRIQDLSLAKSAGTPITGITTDMFGTNRNSLYPCIGAHENLSVIFSGVYSIGTGSVEGQAGNYPTFREAVTALNSQAIFNEDVFMYITSDLEEDCTTGGIGLAVDPSPYTITFKPAPGVSPTVTFNYPSDNNAGPSGAFIIGIPHTNNIAWADATATKNIVFDGSNTIGGETRDLTFANTTGTHRNGMPFLLVGDVENVTVKNLKLFHQATNQSNATQAGFNGALAFRVNHNAENDNAPRNIVVNNNHISVDFSGVSPGYNGINIFKTGSGSLGYIENVSITNNLIEGKANGLFLPWLGDNVQIFENEIKVNQNIGTTVPANAGIQLPVTLADSNISIEANKFSRLATFGNAASNFIHAIDVVSGGNYLIANNMISGFEATETTSHAGIIGGIRVSNVGANALIAHNSLLLNQLENVSGTTNLVYSGINIVSGNVEMKNNIVASDESISHNLLNLAVLPTSMDHNLYHYISGNKGGNLGFYNGAAHSTLTQWQTTTGMDANSIFGNPLFVSDTNLRIQDLSPAKFAGTPLLQVTTDMFGTTRDDLNPSIGAHENQSIAIAGIYSIGSENVPGEQGNFPTFREAVQFLNSDVVFAGDVHMLITSDLLESCTTAENPGIGLAVDPSPHTITFKPAPDKTPTVTFEYFLASNPASEPNSGGPSGAFVIGIDHPTIAWTGAKPTRNIIFDGSNTVGGTTRDLTFTNTTTTHRNGMPFLIVGDVANMEIRNMNIYHKATNQASPTQVGFNGGLSFRINHNVEHDNAPRNIIVENNHISVDFTGVSAGYNGINVFKTNSGFDGYVQNISITENLIEGKSNGLFFAWTGDNINISGNEIRVNQNIGQGILGQAAIQLPVGLPSANVSVIGNHITKVSNIGTGATVSMAGIDIVAGGNFLVANNMISGFEITASVGHSGFLRGLRVNNPSANVNFVYNSILLNNLTNISGATALAYKGIDLVSGSLTMRNNIIETQETDFAHNILDFGTLPSASEHNLYYFVSGSPAAIGLFGQNQYTELAQWQASVNMDANSIFADPLFVSTSNLQIQDTSPARGAGTPVAVILDDIFGTPRDENSPCIGAHENTSLVQLFNVTFNITNQSGQNVANAQVTLAGNTNPVGGYVFNNIPVGNHPFSVTAPGYFTYNGNVAVVDDNVTENVILSIDNTSVNDPESQVSLKIYPNPTKGIASIASNKTISNVLIYDLNGREVFRLEALDVLEHRLDVSGLQNGVYLIRVEGIDWIESKRLIVTK